MSKKKLFIIPIVLLLCLALLVAASFAWINLSRTPEISGINTQVGANGNLEIALLNDNTYMYPYEIGTGVGSSAAATTVQQSNMTWGNVVDLSDESYGLHDVSLLPSRLNLKSYDEGRGVVSGNMLMVPTYSVDGRILNFYSDTVSAIYRGNEFLYDYEQHGYGVRGIGSIMEITPQQAALTNARSLVNSYESAAAGAVTSLWNANGVQLFDIVYRADNVNKTDAVFTKADLAILRDTATRTYGALSYVDSALRQGVVGCLAIDEQSHSTFKSLRDEVLDGQKLLSDVIANKLSEAYKDDDHMEWDDLYSWSVEVESDKALMKSVMVECDNLTASGEAFTWEQVSPIYNKVLNTEYVCFNGDISISYYLDIIYVNSDNIMDLWSDNDLILINGAGPLYNISKYAGKYSVLLSYTSENVIEVSTLENWYTHLEDISEDLKNVYAVGGGSVISAPLEDVYGYAIDLAFRTNAKSNLMLQTDPEMIVDAEGEATQIEGNGSYMSFSSKYLNEEQVVTMMDAVRVGFLDNRNILIGLAKLNTSNYTEEDGTVKASLYMYEYRLSSDGSISMGERRSEDSTIMSLEKATPTILTAVVWLDGDHTDNSIASSLGYSLTGKLNLQFSSDAELKPAGSEVVGGDNSEETTVPEDTTMPEDTTAPEEPKPDDEVIKSDFYLEEKGQGRYAFYSKDEAGNRDYEVVFLGTPDPDNHAIEVVKIDSGTDGNIIIPAIVRNVEDNVEYSVTVNCEKPFENLNNLSSSISFVSVNNKKVKPKSPDASALFGRNDNTDFVSIDMIGFDGSLVTNMSYMFDELRNLTNLNVKNLDTSNVYSMSRMFSECSSLSTLDISGFDTSNVTDMSYAFYDCSGLATLDVSGFDTSNVTDMSYTFYDCSGLATLDVSGFDTSNVTDMSYTFYGCSGLATLDVSGFDTSKVTNMEGLFAFCERVISLDVSGFDTSNVTNMSGLFGKCSSIITVDVTNFDTSRVTLMGAMFAHCYDLTNLDVSSFNTSNVESMSWMFLRCDSLSEIDISSWDMSKVTDDNSMFEQCPAKIIR